MVFILYYFGKSVNWTTSIPLSAGPQIMLLLILSDSSSLLSVSLASFNSALTSLQLPRWFSLQVRARMTFIWEHFSEAYLPQRLEMGLFITHSKSSSCRAVIWTSQMITNHILVWPFKGWRCTYMWHIRDSVSACGACSVDNVHFGLQGRCLFTWPEQGWCPPVERAHW